MINPNASIECIDCGIMPYQDCLTKQEHLVTERKAQAIGNTVLLVEHPPVVTLGARQSANKLLVQEDQLKAQGIDVFAIRRGGGTTAHNPGQIVFYPILDLRSLDLGVNTYVRTLEGIGIDLLTSLGVTAERKPGFPGLWVGPKKIASIGVRVTRMVTFHGMAINIQNDLRIFDLFVPCGLDGVTVTSASQETGQTYDMNTVKQTLQPLIQKALIHP